MELARAQRLKVKQTIHCPADRGYPAGYGEVRGVGTQVSKTMTGKEYVWVTVKRSLHSEVWPSNRLG